jgi:hypothetical protein
MDAILIAVDTRGAPMSEIHLAHFAWSEVTNGHPDRIAINDRHPDAPATPSEEPHAMRRGPLLRLGLDRARLAIAGGPVAIDACSCTA